MESKPVFKQKKVLRILLGNERSVNDIFKQTGLGYKKAVTDTIAELEEAQLLAEKEDQSHSQRRIKYLTELGKEITDIIIGLDEYSKSIRNLHSIVKEKVLFLQGRYLTALQFENKEDQEAVELRKDLKMVLRILGWHDCEIEFYNYSRANIVDLMSFCEKNFLNVLLLRYSIILGSFKLNNAAKGIISSIIMNAINEKVTFMLENLEDNIKGYSTIRVHNPLGEIIPTVTEIGSSSGIVQIFKDVVKMLTSNPLPVVIMEEMRAMLISYLFLLRPPVVNLDLYIWDIKVILEKETDLLNDIAKGSQQGKAFRFRRLVTRVGYFFLGTYKEYCEKRNYHCDVL